MDYRLYFTYLSKITGSNFSIPLSKAKIKIQKRFQLTEEEVTNIISHFSRQNIIKIYDHNISINFLANPTRKRIFALIEEYPGIYINKIKKILRLNSNQVLWHLGFMESKNIIECQQFGSIRAYGPFNVAKSDLLLGYLLLKNSIRSLMKVLLQNPFGITEMEIAVARNQARSSINYTLRKLRGFNVVVVQKLQDGNSFRINPIYSQTIQDKIILIKRLSN
ncbi:MAG: hypothetical protein ACTSYI_11570 [Promethearchaeota archaeon]